ncbi:MAG: tetratricopeptide repeat protein [Bacteroidetes bacterium]|nr:tetratricopeptide repeat protein [Bacteroidota bacterium]
MLTRKARSGVIGIAIILLAWTISKQVYEIAAVIGLGIALLIWGYFREGTVIMAAREFHAKNYNAAEELLKEIADPDKLSRYRRGFYEFIYGNVELHRHNYDEAEKHFQIASKFPLRNQNDRAIVLVHLANINLRKKDYERAFAYVEKAKTFKISSRVENIIEKIESEIKKA